MHNRMDDAFAKVPEGTAWCSHCNGYGSSLKDAGDRCTRCGGTGLVMVADPAGQSANGQPATTY